MNNPTDGVEDCVQTEGRAMEVGSHAMAQNSDTARMLSEEAGSVDSMEEGEMTVSEQQVSVLNSLLLLPPCTKGVSCGRNCHTSPSSVLSHNSRLVYCFEFYNLSLFQNGSFQGFFRPSLFLF